MAGIYEYVATLCCSPALLLAFSVTCSPWKKLLVAMLNNCGGHLGKTCIVMACESIT